MDEKKSMNTHLHVMEAYTVLLRVWDSPLLRRRLRELLDVFLERILDSRTHHLKLFFDETWQCKSNRISFGHDIECSWLMCEAAKTLADNRLVKRVEPQSIDMVESIFQEALDPDGGILYEADPTGIIDGDKHWWPQAEGVVGFLNAFELTGNDRYFSAAARTWGFIRQFIADREHGEWFWKVSREGVPSQEKFKLDLWKCPYHNSRCCIEVMERTERLMQSLSGV